MTDAGRYRLTLTLDGKRALDGWWNDLAIARKQFRTAVGDYGRDGATVTLVDTATGATIDSWPKPVVSGAS